MTGSNALSYLRTIKEFIKVSNIERSLSLPSGSLRKALDNQDQTSYKYEDEVKSFVDRVLLSPNKRVKDEDLTPELVEDFRSWLVARYHFPQFQKISINRINKVYDINKLIWEYLILDREAFYSIDRAFQIVVKFKELYKNS